MNPASVNVIVNLPKWDDKPSTWIANETRRVRHKKTTLFNFERNQVRTMLINGEPYFVGKDATLAIGYTETSIRNAIKSQGKDKYKR